MSVYTLYRKQILPITIDEAWDFFSRPENLNEITPPDLDFIILSKDIKRMYPGQMILYSVKTLPLIRNLWLTEITHVIDKKLFVDEQRVGPYALWHHQHIFTEVEHGVLMEDIVTYRLPFGILGKIVHAIFVKKKLEHIFDFRFRYLEQKFGKP